MPDAARSGNIARLTALLDAGADPNRPDTRGFPPIILASYNAQAEATALLIARGAAVDGVDAAGATALMGAAFKGHVAIACQLLAAGAAVDAANETGRTALVFGHANIAA